MRVFGRQPPGDRSAPVMPDDEGLRLTGSIDQTDYVACQFVERVRCKSIRLIAQVIAALVRRPHTITGRGQVRNLPPPAVPELGKTMQQHHQGSITWAVLDDMQADTVCSDLLVLHDGGV